MPPHIPSRRCGNVSVRIELAPYDTTWPARFELERERLRSALGDRALQIEHIGSTAVPGLAAKPVIDILIAVDDISHPQLQPALEKFGYALVVDEPGHRMYRPATMDVHVHLWRSDDTEVERHIAFRDWLRLHPDERELYAHVKRAFAEREWTDGNEYADAKTPVISAILRRARGQARGPRVGMFSDVISQYAPPPGRVLEIGAGEGELAALLQSRGYEVVALDRHLRSRFPVIESAFEEYAAPAASFDCITAQLVLHHVDDIGATLEKVSRLLRPSGIVAIDDYGWERSNDAGFREDRADLHTSQAMLRALRSHFTEIAYFDHAYFEEGAGTDRLGFTFIGRRLD